MAALREWLLRVWGTVRRGRHDQDLEEELRLHLELAAAEARRRGDSPTVAARRARLDAGGVSQALEALSDQRGLPWLEDLVRDVRHGLRALARRPAFTLAATLTLTLAVAGTSTVFSLLDAVLLRPLPVRDPEELAHIYTSCRRGDPYCASSYPEFLDYRSKTRTFVDMAAFLPVELSVGSGAGKWVGSGLLVSPNYFSLLGVQPHTGRVFTPGTDGSGEPAIVLAYDAWQSRFGGDDAVIGTTIRMSSNPFLVLGVAPPGFHGTQLGVRPAFWMPIDHVSLTPAGVGRNIVASRSTRWISGTIGRLRPGTTIAQAQSDMQLISDGLQTTDPTRAGRFVTVEPAPRAALPPSSTGSLTRFVMLLMGSVGATLFIACANIAGLLLARGAARRHELELRRALGAGRGRLVRQLLAEYLPLAVAGTAGGLVVARWAIAWLSAYTLPGAVAVTSLDLGVDGRVMAFAALLLVVTGLFGLFPALGATHGIAAASAARTTSEGGGSPRGQGALLGVQVAVTVVLLVGAGLFIRSLQRGLALDLGLTSHPVVMASIAPALERYPPARTLAVVDDVTSRLAGLPDVVSASAAMLPPLSIGSGFLAQRIDGYPAAPDEEMRFESNFVEPDYFRTLGIEIRSGREFTSADREGAPLVAMISETMARRYWDGRDPIGGHLSARLLGEQVEVVGVAADVTVGLDGRAEPFVYFPLRQHPRFLGSSTMTVFARAAGNPAALIASMRGVLPRVDPALPVMELATLDSRVGDLLMPQRLGSSLLSALASLTVLLVAVGVAGIIGYTVSRRRREIGVRLALGARRAQVAATMMRGVLVPLTAGALLGVAGALALGRLVSGFLYGIAPTDLGSFAFAATVLAIVAGLALLVPAWRATGINPTEVLDAE